MLGAVLKLKPFSPLTPSGIPMLMGVPPGVVSSWLAAPSAWVLGDSFTVREEFKVASFELEIVELGLGLTEPRLEAALPIPPIGETPGSLPAPIMEGGSI